MINSRAYIANGAIIKWIRRVGLKLPVRQIVDCISNRSENAIKSSSPVVRVAVRQCHELGSAVGLHPSHPKAISRCRSC